MDKSQRLIAMEPMPAPRSTRSRQRAARDLDCQDLSLMLLKDVMSRLPEDCSRRSYAKRSKSCELLHQCVLLTLLQCMDPETVVMELIS